MKLHSARRPPASDLVRLLPVGVVRVRWRNADVTGQLSCCRRRALITSRRASNISCVCECMCDNAVYRCIPLARRRDGKTAACLPITPGAAAAGALVAGWPMSSATDPPRRRVGSRDPSQRPAPARRLARCPLGRSRRRNWTEHGRVRATTAVIYKSSSQPGRPSRARRKTNAGSAGRDA